MVPATPLLHPPGVTAATRRPLQSSASSAAGAGSGSGKELEMVEMVLRVVKVAAVVRCPASRVPSGRLRAAGGSSCHHSAAPARPSSRPRHGAGRGRHTSGRGGAGRHLRAAAARTRWSRALAHTPPCCPPPPPPAPAPRWWWWWR